MTDDPWAPRPCYRHAERETRVICQRCDRPVCASCQTPAAVGVQCPECVRAARAVPRGRRVPVIVRAFTPNGAHIPVVTWTLFGVLVLAYLAQWLTGGLVTGWGVMFPPAIASEPWRLITAAFLHAPANPLHLIFNAYALVVFGSALESFLGRLRFLALYLVSAFAGNVASVVVYQIALVAPDSVAASALQDFASTASLGASGAIFGLFGAALAMRRAMGIDSRQLLLILGLNVLITFLAPGIAWQAHVGGFAIGAAIGRVFLATRRPSDQPRQVVWLLAMSVALGLVCVACVVSTPADYF